MSAVNAFDWKAYTDEEHARKGDPFKEIKRNAVISKNVTEGVHRLREIKPSHGTVFGITEKRLSFRTPDMMPIKGGARPGAGRKLPNIDERRALKLLADGMTKKKIAEQFDIPYKTMLTFFKKLGAKNVRGPYSWTGKYKGANNG